MRTTTTGTKTAKKTWAFGGKKVAAAKPVKKAGKKVVKKGK